MTRGESPELVGVMVGVGGVECQQSPIRLAVC